MCVSVRACVHACVRACVFHGDEHIRIVVSFNLLLLYCIMLCYAVLYYSTLHYTTLHYTMYSTISQCNVCVAGKALHYVVYC